MFTREPDKKKVYSFEDKLGFGKYKGISLYDVLEVDVDYIIWAVKEGVIEVDDYVQRFLNKVKENREDGINDMRDLKVQDLKDII